MYIAFKKRLENLLVLGCACFCISTSLAAQEELDAEINEYFAVFNVRTGILDIDEIVRVSKEMQWKGITSMLVYDAVNSRLVDLIADDAFGRGAHSKAAEFGLLMASMFSPIPVGVSPDGYTPDQSQTIAHLAKLLGCSGNEKYRPILEVLSASSSPYSRHAEESLRRLGKYSLYNSEISAGLEDADIGDLERHRVINMINSKYFILVRQGSMMASRNYLHDEELADIAEKKLRVSLDVKGDEYHVDGVKWLMKFLALTGNGKYLSVMEYAAKNAKNQSVRNDAKSRVMGFRWNENYGR